MRRSIEALIATIMVASVSSVVFPAQLLGAQTISQSTVEPCVEFWVKQFGNTTTNQVPGPEGKLMFASVSTDGVEVMYQSKASVVADSTVNAVKPAGRSAALLITVENLNAVEKAVAGAPAVKARHKTSHGSTELYVREPGGEYG